MINFYQFLEIRKKMGSGPAIYHKTKPHPDWIWMGAPETMGKKEWTDQCVFKILVKDNSYADHVAKLLKKYNPTPTTSVNTSFTGYRPASFTISLPREQMHHATDELYRKLARYADFIEIERIGC